MQTPVSIRSGSPPAKAGDPALRVGANADRPSLLTAVGCPRWGFSSLRRPRLLALFLCGLAVLGWVEATRAAGQYRFDGTMSREVLENYLSRAITMEGLFNGRGDLDDNLRMLKSMGAKFIGRSLCLWSGEANFLRNLERAKQQVPKAHAADREMLLQACVFEIVSSQVEQIPVPGWVFTALGQPVEKRNFRYEDMIYPEGQRRNWGRNASVPDVSRMETKLWFYYQAASYIDLGFEAIHFGQVEISWFAHQSKEYRANWLRYAWDWVRKTDPNGFLQMPGSRTRVSPLDGKRWYYANTPSAAVPDGLGDEEAIRAIWAEDAAKGSVR